MRDSVIPTFGLHSRNDCELCGEFIAAGTSPREIIRFPGMVAAPTLGCFVEGYTLLMPTTHVSAFADLPHGMLATLGRIIDHIRNAIGARYGFPVIVAEHGATACDAGASCVDHAHLHFVPVADVRRVRDEYAEAGGDPRILSSAAALASCRSSAYVYLSPTPAEHLAWPADQFVSQFVRRVCARQHGCGDRYDWRAHRFEGNMQRTCEALRPALAAAGSIVQPSAGRISHA